MSGFEFEEEKKLKNFEEFYFRIRNVLTAQVYSDAFRPDAIPLADTVDRIEKINNTPVKLALSECFKLLDVHLGFDNKTTIKDLKLKLISEDFKSRPDLIMKLVLPKLILNPKLSLDQIKAID
jgi:hypothetical protein